MAGWARYGVAAVGGGSRLFEIEINKTRPDKEGAAGMMAPASGAQANSPAILPILKWPRHRGG